MNRQQARWSGDNKENWPVGVRARRRRRNSAHAATSYIDVRVDGRFITCATRGATAAEIAAWNQAEFAAMRLHPSYSCVQGTGTVMCVCV